MCNFILLSFSFSLLSRVVFAGLDFASLLIVQDFELLSDVISCLSDQHEYKDNININIYRTFFIIFN